jgi:hypothetical protein
VTNAPVTAQDFLLDDVNTYAISGTVLEDLINLGVIDNPGDTPLLGVVVELRDADGNVIATTVTDSEGNYSFENLIPGDYQVTVQTPAGATHVTDADGGNPNLIEVELTNADVTGQDFLLDGTEVYTISGTVLNDTTDPGVINNPGDTPLGGVTVELRDGDGNVIATTVTEPDGSYSFDVVPGDYQVTTVTPDGATHVTDADGDGNGANFVAVSVTNADVTGQDFLLKVTPTAVTLLSFDVVPVDTTTLRIEWSTATEFNTQGFHLWRSETGDRSQAVRITTEMIESQGDLLFGAEYLFIDGPLQPETGYSYWLQEIEVNGKVTEYGPVTASTSTASGDEPGDTDGHNRIYLPFLNR